MPLGEKNIRRITAGSLIVATLATRLPLASKMLYEFDSIDFAVATFRYSLEQVTPHFPGYILHILFAKFLLLFTSDVNQAFVWISMLLSIGSVLYLWRAAAALRGERVGLIAAGIWLFLPIFWFHGLVSTVYEYEAFFACAFLYHGIKLFRSPKQQWHFFALCIMLSLATGSRQSSLIFFSPAVLFIALITRQQFKTLAAGFGLFILTTGTWLSILLVMCGGLRAYITAMQSEHVYRSQSVLFGNELKEHLAVMAKVVVYLISSGFSFVLVLLVALLLYPKRFLVFCKSLRRSRLLQYISLIALPPLIFYLAVYFMKGGYLLNVLPSGALAAAVLIDQIAIWRAENIKTRPGNALLLTRPLITKTAMILTGSIILLEIAWFSIRLPFSTDEAYYYAFSTVTFDRGLNEATRASTGMEYILTRILFFTSYYSIEESDRLHSSVRSTLETELSKHPNLVLLDNWWNRWAYYYLPTATIYDLLNNDKQGYLSVGKSNYFVREVVLNPVVDIPANAEVLLLMRHDHPDFKHIADQLQLERLPLPEYLDIWKVKTKGFTFVWLDKTFTQAPQ
ncbi:MAG TPA: glycosyltransferase family 39 protein [Candidatus Kapabacteria bacterium]|nr:glycosyltransferase family 39 protein [Candidatus Kapabacteria bacterium]